MKREPASEMAFNFSRIQTSSAVLRNLSITCIPIISIMLASDIVSDPTHRRSNDAIDSIVNIPNFGLPHLLAIFETEKSLLAMERVAAGKASAAEQVRVMPGTHHSVQQ